MSESKKIKELLAKIRKLEKLNEQKQIVIEFKEKMIEIASQIYSIDIKKNMVPKFPVVLAYPRKHRWQVMSL
jgi:hypothetical protein